MTWSKQTKQTRWRQRKRQNNPPHGNVKSFEQLAEEAGKEEKGKS